jgi:hypothetical protein
MDLKVELLIWEWLGIAEGVTSALQPLRGKEYRAF